MTEDASEQSDDEITYSVSVGNVFADLGLPDPEIALVKADLALHVARLVEERGWTPDTAADRLGLDAAQLSRILVGDIGSTPLESLLALVTCFGRDVEIAVVPTAHERGSLAVRGAAD